MKFVIDPLTGAGIDEAIRGVEEYQRWVRGKAALMVQRFAEIGFKVAKVTFSAARYDGENDVNVTIEQRGENACAVVATGEATLFIEFGSGSMMGYGHPEPQGYGPGTWSDGPGGKGHWDDPNGWYLPKEKGGGKSYGNPPAGAMYSAVKEIELEFERVAREVFA